MEYRAGLYTDEKKRDEPELLWSLKLTDEKQNADGVLYGVAGLSEANVEIIRRSEIWRGTCGQDESGRGGSTFDYGWDPDTRWVWVFDPELDPSFYLVAQQRWGNLHSIMRAVAQRIEDEYWENRP